MAPLDMNTKDACCCCCCLERRREPHRLSTSIFSSILAFCLLLRTTRTSVTAKGYTLQLCKPLRTHRQRTPQSQNRANGQRPTAALRALKVNTTPKLLVELKASLEEQSSCSSSSYWPLTNHVLVGGPFFECLNRSALQRPSPLLLDPGLLMVDSTPLPPQPFPAPVLLQGHLEPSYPPGLRDNDRELIRDSQGRGKALISDDSGRRWELVRDLRECIYGAVLLAIEFRVLPDGTRQYAAQHAAVKVMFWDRIRANAGHNNEVQHCTHLRTPCNTLPSSRRFAAAAASQQCSAKL
jgi:hypothetical protein